MLERASVFTEKPKAHGNGGSKEKPLSPGPKAVFPKALTCPFFHPHLSSLFATETKNWTLLLILVSNTHCG